MRCAYCLLGIALLLAGSTKAFAQEEDDTLCFAITTQPLQYFFNDFPLKIEYFFRRQSVGITLGYRPSTQADGAFPSNQVIKYTELNMLNPLYNAYLAALSSKVFLKGAANFYIEGELFYRHWWFNNKDCSYWLDNTYRFSGTRTEKQDVYGAKILIGKVFVLNPENNVKVLVEPFVGVSYRYKTYRFETFKGRVNSRYEDYILEEGTNQQESSVGNKLPFGFQMGVRMGLGF